MYRRPRARCISYLILFFVLNVMFYIGSFRLWIKSSGGSSRDVVARASAETEYRQNSYVEANDSNTHHPVEGPKQEPGRIFLVHSYVQKDKSAGRFYYHFNKCKYSACAMTSDPDKADLLMFDGELMKDAVLPPHRPQGQIWLVHSSEPPLRSYFLHLNRSDLLDQFNWTRFIHNDSTFWTRHGQLYQRPAPDKDYKSIYRNKPYDVAWFVSNCHTQSLREKYIERMTSEIDVHIYGKCGTMKCGGPGSSMSGEKDACLNMLSQKYKFYLSFESTLCESYTSEKFFNMFEDVDVIPVVRGGADYHNRFPPDTSIVSSDFSSPESLAKYLHSLARDEKRYIELLKNKNRYFRGRLPTEFHCDLCEALHLGQPVNVYHDMVAWLRRPDKCWEPKDL